MMSRLEHRRAGWHLFRPLFGRVGLRCAASGTTSDSAEIRVSICYPPPSDFRRPGCCDATRCVRGCSGVSGVDSATATPESREFPDLRSTPAARARLIGHRREAKGEASSHEQPRRKPGARSRSVVDDARGRLCECACRPTSAQRAFDDREREPRADPGSPGGAPAVEGAVRVPAPTPRGGLPASRLPGIGPGRGGDGAPDFQLVVASTPLAVYLDLAFRFEIVDGDGRVSTSGRGD